MPISRQFRDYSLIALLVTRLLICSQRYSKYPDPLPFPLVWHTVKTVCVGQLTKNLYPAAYCAKCQEQPPTGTGSQFLHLRPLNRAYRLKTQLLNLSHCPLYLDPPIAPQIELC